MLDGLMKQTVDRRDFWYEFLRGKVEGLGLTTPTKPPIAIVNYPLRSRFFAGKYYHSHRIELNLATFFIDLGKHVDSTVAHEMCHAFQFHLEKDSPSHGELFTLLAKVCQIPLTLKLEDMHAPGAFVAFKSFSKGLPRIIYDEAGLAESAGTSPDGVSRDTDPSVQRTHC